MIYHVFFILKIEIIKMKLRVLEADIACKQASLNAETKSIENLRKEGRHLVADGLENSFVGNTQRQLRKLCKEKDILEREVC